jgi:hypothetical protein
MWGKCASSTSFVGSLIRTVHKHYTTLGRALSCTTRTRSGSYAARRRFILATAQRLEEHYETALAVPLAPVVMGAGFPITTGAGVGYGQRCAFIKHPRLLRLRQSVGAAVPLGLARPGGCRTTLTDGLRSEGRDERVLFSRHQCSTPARLGTQCLARRVKVETASAFAGCSGGR